MGGFHTGEPAPRIRQEQLDFLDWEFGVFFHFGIRTFYEGRADWDEKPMAPQGFCPQALDCDDWLRTARDAGARYAVLVCKHHDGFANWPSAFTDYSVKHTPWKGGKGDVVREFTDACRKYGLRVGFYYSPAQFGSRALQGAAYDDYFIGQIKELLTGYGDVDYLWFDGCGCEGHRFDTARIVREIRALQPHILLFNLWDPDTRWVGNEAGVADSPNPLFIRGAEIAPQPGAADGAPRFLPTECDCRMRETSWFYSDCDSDTVKTLDELMGLYYYSVGRGANLLLNVSPDRSGTLPARDKAALLRFGETVKRQFSSPVSCRRHAKKNTLTLTFETQPVNHVVLSEEIAGDCEIEAFEVRACPFPYGAPVTVFRGTTVGHKAICPFPTIRTGRLELVFDREKRVHADVFYRPAFR